MIHQFIFAGPKPGMTEIESQWYWIEVHAVKCASRIPQIRQYLIAARESTPVGCDVGSFEGIGDIWLSSDDDQIASLQSPDLLDGARRDEPRRAAFWRTFLVGTESQTASHAAGIASAAMLTKACALLKRIPSLDRRTFHERFRGEHAARVRALPAQRRDTTAAARDGQYGFGEPRFDTVDTWACEDVNAVERVAASGKFAGVIRGLADSAIDDARRKYAGADHWTIRPDERPASTPAAAYPAEVATGCSMCRCGVTTRGGSRRTSRGDRRGYDSRFAIDIARDTLPGDLIVARLEGQSVGV